MLLVMVMLMGRVEGFAWSLGIGRCNLLNRLEEPL